MIPFHAFRADITELEERVAKNRKENEALSKRIQALEDAAFKRGRKTSKVLGPPIAITRNGTIELSTITSVKLPPKVAAEIEKESKRRMALFQEFNSLTHRILLLKQIRDLYYNVEITHQKA